MKNPLSRPFLIVLMIAVFIACFFVFRPFLIEIIMAAVLTTILYNPYRKLKKFFRNKSVPAALVMCLLSLLLIILPLTELVIYAAKESITAYSDTLNFLNQNSAVIHSKFLDKLSFLGFNTDSIKSFVVDIAGRFSDFIVSGATVVLKETTAFIFSLFVTVFSMFFFFVDGEHMIKKLMRWSPLPDKYDYHLFEKFRDVSYSAIISNFVVIFAQGLVGGIGYAIVGLPAFVPGLLITICSLIPIVGAMVVYVPTGIYLLAIGSTWQGIFVLLWGFLLVGTVDNVLRVILLKGKTRINPIFIFLSIMGGVSLFGFWGVVLGPLAVSLAVTVMHIYEMEFKKDLDSNLEPTLEAALVGAENIKNKK